MKSEENREKIYCIFNNEKENFQSQLEKAFKVYLKDVAKDSKSQNGDSLNNTKQETKEKFNSCQKFEIQAKQIYNNIADDC